MPTLKTLGVATGALTLGILVSLAGGCIVEEEPVALEQELQDARMAAPTRKRQNKLYLDGRGRLSTPRGVFPSVSAWFASKPFGREIPRCSSERRARRAQRRLAVTGRTPVFKSQADCTLSFTNIENEYELTDNKLVVPVVFHVIQRNDGTGNMSNEQILSQVEILNEDFSAEPGTPGDGGPKSEDVHIEFVLAGITRESNNNWFDDPEAFEEDFKQALHWDVDRYLNIYTVGPNSGGLGWAYLPQDAAGEPEYDGVVLDFTTVGRDAPGAPYNQGRTATHEVGHYLGLQHTFHPNDGDGISGVCQGGWNGGDLIQSTPSQPEPTYGCPAQEDLCSGLEPAISANVHNYMNYTEDTCMFYFDIQQANRSVCGLVNYRPDLYLTVPHDYVVKSFVEHRTPQGYILGTIYTPQKPLPAGSRFILGGMANTPTNGDQPTTPVRARVWTGPPNNPEILGEDMSSGLSPAFIDIDIDERTSVRYSVRRVPNVASYTGFAIYLQD